MVPNELLETRPKTDYRNNKTSGVFYYLKNSVERYPAKPFVVDHGLTWTYAAVYERVQALARHLKAHDIKPGDRIILYLDNSIEYIVAFYAILLLDGVIVPLNKYMSQDVFDLVVKETTPGVIITSKPFQQKLNSQTLPQDIRLLAIDDFLKNSSVDGDTKSEILPSMSQGKGQLAMLLFTSGTTNLPKGVMLTHGNLMANTDSILGYLTLKNSDTMLVTLPFGYSYGNSVLLTHTRVGGTLYIENRTPFPEVILQQLQINKIRGYSTVGSYLNVLLKQKSIDKVDLSGLRYVTFAGESVFYDDVIKLSNIAPHVKIYVMYGQTEATARLSYLAPDLIFKKPNCIGQAIPGVTLRVISDGRDVSPGEIGEVIARGANIMQGYWHDVEETKKVLKDEWLHTGDLATVDEEGYIYIKGREKDMIKISGHRISPLEIEAAINSYQEVMESAVIEAEEAHVAIIKAYIVPKSGGIIQDLLDEHLRKILPPLKIPREIEITDKIPRTSSGKIQRSILREKNKKS
jgi:acyl-CoA synthetase (AMP-forming)/AMP-acid ligase II